MQSAAKAHWMAFDKAQQGAGKNTSIIGEYEELLRGPQLTVYTSLLYASGVLSSVTI